MQRLSNGNRDDVDLSTPVLRRDMERGEFIIAMDAALANRFPPDSLMTRGRLAQHGQYRRAVKLFSEFIAPRETVNLTEATIDEFMEFLLAHGSGTPDSLAEYKSNIRCLVNDLPDGMRREVATPTASSVAGGSGVVMRRL